jgi:hypothetical protein
MPLFSREVTNAAKLGDRLIFIIIIIISLMLGKYSLVTNPLVVASQCCCHFPMGFSDSRLTISLFGILLANFVVFGGHFGEFIC